MGVGVLAAPGVALDLAERLAEDLPRELAERFPEIEKRAEATEVEPAEPSSSSRELIDTVRRRLLTEGWDLPMA